MTSWTLHLPPDGDSDVSDMERFVAVKDGLRPFAILFGPLWFLWKRLWLGALGVVLVEAGLIGVTWQLGLPRPALGVLQALFHILVGLEAASVQRWTLHRKGWREVGTISAHGRTEAELRAAALLADMVDTRPAAEPVIRAAFASSVQARPGNPPASPVLGLFPEAQPR